MKSRRSEKNRSGNFFFEGIRKMCLEDTYQPYVSRGHNCFPAIEKILPASRKKMPIEKMEGTLLKFQQCTFHKFFVK